MVKLIVSDLDGTLLDGNGAVPPGFFPLLPRLRERGIRFVVATGRQFQSARERFLEAGPELAEMLFITHNGAHVVEGERTLEHRPLDRALVEELLRVTREQLRDVVPILFTAEIGYLTGVSNEVEEWMRKAGLHCRRAPDLMNVARERDVIRFTARDEAGTAANSFPLLNREFGGRSTVAMAGPRWMDVVAPGVDKGTALEVVQRRLNIPPRETMVFGDYHNDLAMLRLGHYSFAMGNACEEVLRTARFRCASNREQGVVRTLERMLSGDLEPAAVG